MQIAGIQKLTLVDFPGHVAATIFTRGCTFRCPFCHNPELVVPEQFSPLLNESQIFDFLESRYGKLTGICLTGGEPTMQPDCDKFISHLKALGFDMKLDTNGINPKMLEKIIADRDVDYIAMDIKAPLRNYGLATGRSNNSTIQQFDNDIIKSIDLIIGSGIDYEFRTTVCHPLHEPSDFVEIGKMIKDAKRYYIQNFVESKHVDAEENFTPFSEAEMKESLKNISPLVEKAFIR